VKIGGIFRTERGTFAIANNRGQNNGIAATPAY